MTIINYNKYKIFVFDLDYTLFLHDNHNSIYNDKIIELLTCLKNNNKILCIATHNRSPYEYLKKMQISEYFNYIVSEKKILCSLFNSIEDYTSKKDMLLEIIDNFKCNIEDIIFFDDSNYNILEVKSLGIKSIFVPNSGININEIIQNLNY